ncbi:CynX/NimT family MFS transporter [Paraburkholderia sp. BCC1886]|uniref:MFS transporter n=1 Tax=Paraburkholderia sp. BCC1886 TaxID=2562670 RepID=UPI001C928E34|nr:MFS transporter [Paraburkholderia sp. BCC1886]
MSGPAESGAYASSTAERTHMDGSTPPTFEGWSPLSDVDTEQESPPPVNSTLAIVAIILVATSLRPGIVAVGPVLPSIISDFRLSHTAASLLTSIPDVLMGLLAILTPRIARRFGREPAILAALLLLCISIAGRAFSTSVFGLFVSTAGVGVGIAVAGTLMASFIKARFASHAAVVMGVYATALSFGSTASAGFTGPAAQATGSGWRLASGMWSATAILAIASWLAVAIMERRRHTPAIQSKSLVRLPVRSATAWFVAIFFACDNFLFYALVSWTSPIYREAGQSATRAGLTLASFTAAFMLANPIFGWLSRSHDRRRWLAASAVLSLAGLIPTALAPAMAPFLFIPLCAFGLGGGFTLGMTLPLDNTDNVDETNAWNAFVLTVGYLIAAAGPLLVGKLRDMSGSFQSAIWALVLVAGLMLALTPFLRSHRQREDP